jgi:transposase
LVGGDADKTRLRVYRRGDDWYCTFNIEYETEPTEKTPIGVDIGERHVLAVTAYGEGGCQSGSFPSGPDALERHRWTR